MEVKHTAEFVECNGAMYSPYCLAASYLCGGNDSASTRGLALHAATRIALKNPLLQPVSGSTRTERTDTSTERSMKSSARPSYEPETGIA